MATITTGQTRQGETFLLLVSPDRVPGSYAKTSVEQPLLAIGETGNAHTLRPKQAKGPGKALFNWLTNTANSVAAIQKAGAAEEVMNGNRVYLEVTVEAEIHHSDRSDQGHKALNVPPGVYRVIIKREVLPWEDELRAVAD